MKAIRFHEIGGPDVLQYDEIERPQPGLNEKLEGRETVGKTISTVD
jgi:NADPH:quinone reductase-like Zn-dependent oxidoreductase